MQTAWQWQHEFYPSIKASLSLNSRLSSATDAHLMQQSFHSISKGTWCFTRHILPCSQLAIRTKPWPPNSHRATLRAYASTLTLRDGVPTTNNQIETQHNDVRGYLRRWKSPVVDSHHDESPLAKQRHHELPRPRSTPEYDSDLDAIMGGDATAHGNDFINDERDEYLDGSTDLSEFIHYTLALDPGDLIYMGHELAVFIRREQNAHTFMTPDGRCFVPPARLHRSYTIKKFASPDHVAALSAALELDPTLVSHSQAADLEAKSPPTVLTSPILLQLQALQQEMNEFNRLNPTVMDTVYEAAQPDTFHSFAFEPFLDTLLPDQQPLSEAAKLAMMVNFDLDMRFVILPLQSQTSIALLPHNLWDACNRVVQWSRSYQDAAARAVSGVDVSEPLSTNPLTSFIAKARSLILQSRRYRSPTSLSTLGASNLDLPRDSVEPSNQIVNDAFSAHDKEIISFLWVLYCMVPHFTGRLRGQYTSVGSLILRALGAYPKTFLDHRVGKLAMQEIGCLTPWQDFTFFNVFAPLASLGFDPVIKNLEREINALKIAHKSKPDMKILSEDSLADLRKDWGNLPVYTIDDSQVVTKDDGISLQESTRHPGSYWIRMHVADIASYLPREHPLARKALWTGTPYFGRQFTEHLFDRSLTGNNSVRSGGPVLTISTLVDQDGQVQGVDITPGRVHNIINIDASVLSRTVRSFNSGERVILNLTKQRDQPQDVSSSNMDQNHQKRSLQAVQEHMSFFIQLSEILDKRFAARDADIPSRTSTRKAYYYGTTVALGTPEDSPHFSSIYQSVHYRQDPSILLHALKYPFKDPLRGGSLSRGLIGDCAMLAEESIGKWLFERNIPAIYSGNKFVPGHSARQLIQQELDQRQNPDAESIDPKLGRPVFALSTKPSVNLSTSTRYSAPVTNPLRSGVDLAAHYQINAYLRANADFLLNRKTKEEVLKALPYSETDLKTLLARLGYPAIVSRMSSESSAHWFYQAFHRAFHFKEVDLPKIWDVIMLRGVDNTLKGRTFPFGLKVVFEDSEQGFEIDVEDGMFLPCEIREVDTVERVLRMVAIGPVTEEPSVETSLPMATEETNLSLSKSRS